MDPLVELFLDNSSLDSSLSPRVKSWTPKMICSLDGCWLDSGNRHKEGACKITGWSCDISSKQNRRPREAHVRLLSVGLFHGCSVGSTTWKLMNHSSGNREIPWFSPYHKVNAALLMSAYGMHAALLDDYLQMAEDKIIKCTKMFAETIMKV